MTAVKRSGPVCVECGRRFDLSVPLDRDEWSFGHDCEPVEFSRVKSVDPREVGLTSVPCLSCGARVGSWCFRHGQVMPGPLLACRDRVRLASSAAVLELPRVFWLDHENRDLVKYSGDSATYTLEEGRASVTVLLDYRDILELYSDASHYLSFVEVEGLEDVGYSAQCTLEVLERFGFAAVPCPVGELVGGHHYYRPGSGVRVSWSVFGDRRKVVRVCPDCARDSELGIEGPWSES